MRKLYGMITLTGIFFIIITETVNAQNKCPLTRNQRLEDYDWVPSEAKWRGVL
jgi:hypothetical protein